MITFYGRWSLDVVGNVGEFPQRVLIAGSLASDGVIAATLGTIVPEIDGAAWDVFLERHPWHPWCALHVAIHEAIGKSNDLVFRCTLSGSRPNRGAPQRTCRRQPRIGRPVAAGRWAGGPAPSARPRLLRMPIGMALTLERVWRTIRAA